MLYTFQNSNPRGWESTFVSVTRSSRLGDLPSGHPTHNDTAVAAPRLTSVACWVTAEHLPSIYALAQSLKRHKPTKDCEIISNKWTSPSSSQHKTRPAKEGVFASLRSYGIILQILLFIFHSSHRKAVQESSPWMYVTMMMTDQIPLDLPPPLLNGEVAMMPHMINVNGDGSQQVSFTPDVMYTWNAIYARSLCINASARCIHINANVSCYTFIDQGFLKLSIPWWTSK